MKKGRDIDALKLRHQVATSQAVSTSKGLHQTFPEHFDFIQNKHSAGVLIKQFSALVTDKNDDKNAEKNLIQGVSIHHFTDLNFGNDNALSRRVGV